MSDERNFTAGDRELSAVGGLTAMERVERDSPGALLRAERERQGLRLQRIADDLHLSLATMEAIEADRFAELGATVFARGHLRRYALLLNLSVDDILERYERLSSQARAHDPMLPQPRLTEMRRTEMPREASSFRIAPRAGGRWAMRAIAWIAVGIAMITMIVWFGHSTWSNAKKTKSAPTAVAAEQAIPTVAPPPAAESGKEASVLKTPPPAPSVKPKAASNASSAARVSDGKLRLRLSYSEESWTEAYDAQGNRMLYGVGKPDMPRVVDITPPVQLILGNTAAVSIEVNGRPVTLPAQRVAAGRATKITLNANGEIN